MSLLLPASFFDIRVISELSLSYQPMRSLCQLMPVHARSTVCPFRPIKTALPTQPVCALLLYQPNTLSNNSAKQYHSTQYSNTVIRAATMLSPDRLLALPAELRIQIYQYYMHSSFSPRSPDSLQKIFQLDKQITREYKAEFLSEAQHSARRISESLATCSLVGLM